MVIITSTGTKIKRKLTKGQQALVNTYLEILRSPPGSAIPAIYIPKWVRDYVAKWYKVRPQPKSRTISRHYTKVNAVKANKTYPKPSYIRKAPIRSSFKYQVVKRR